MTETGLQMPMRPKVESLRRSAGWATRYLRGGRKAGLKNPRRIFRRMKILSAVVKKNTLAQHLRRNTCVRAGIQTTGKTAPTVQSKCRDNLPLLFASPSTCRNRLRCGSFLWSSSGKTKRTLWDNIIGKHCSSCHTNSCAIYT